MRTGLNTQKQAVNSGHFLLFRYNPDLAAEGKNPLQLDSKKPTLKYDEFAYNQTRFKMLTKSNPEQAKKLIELAQGDVLRRWNMYEQLAGMHAGAGNGNGGNA